MILASLVGQEIARDIKEKAWSPKGEGWMQNLLHVSDVSWICCIYALLDAHSFVAASLQLPFLSEIDIGRFGRQARAIFWWPKERAVVQPAFVLFGSDVFGPGVA